MQPQYKIHQKKILNPPEQTVYIHLSIAIYINEKEMYALQIHRVKLLYKLYVKVAAIR